MNKLAVVFSGQGSQYQGMGLDYIEHHKTYRDQTDLASKLLGFDVVDILKNDPQKINETYYAQPLILLINMFGYQAFKSLKITPDGLLGFSLGEYSAYYASGLFDFKQIIEIILKRATYMHDCAQRYPGKMAAVLGLEQKKLDQLLLTSKSFGLIQGANYNSKDQIVISGEIDAMDHAISFLKENGAKRVIELKVSGAFHSVLMHDAAIKLYQDLEAFNVGELNIPIYLNTTAKPLIKTELFEHMKKQIESPVYFYQSIENMIKDGFTHFLEIGPKAVLSGLIKKINSDAEVANLDQLKDIERVKGWLEYHGFIK